MTNPIGQSHLMHSSCGCGLLFLPLVPLQVCIQQKQRQLRKATEELNGLCVLLAKDFQEKAFLNLTHISMKV